MSDVVLVSTYADTPSLLVEESWDGGYWRTAHADVPAPHRIGFASATPPLGGSVSAEVR